MQKYVIFAEEKSKTFAKDKNYQKVRVYCHYTGKQRGAAHSICNLTFSVSNEIPAVFCNDSSYNYHFIIKELANQFEGQFECLGEKKEKQKTFSILIKKEIAKIDENGNESVKNISYKIKFIDSARFMASSLSNHVDNLTGRIHKINVKIVIIFLNIKMLRTIL